MISQIANAGANEQRTEIWDYDGDGRVTVDLITLWMAGASQERITIYAYDAAGNKIQTTQTYGTGTGVNTSFAYTYQEFDLDNRLTKVIDADSNSTTFAYDAAGNKTQRTDPTGKSSTYQYDAANRRTQSIDRDGWSISYAYERGLGHERENWYNAYGTPQKTLAFICDEGGNMTSAATYDGGGSPLYD